MFPIAPAARPAVIANVIFTAVAFIVVLMRLCTRVFVLKNLGVDDGLIVLSMLASIAFLAVVFLQIKAGLGRMMTFPELPGFFHALWATIPIYNLAICLCKLSITMQCYRVLRTPKMQRFFRVYFVVLVLYGLWAVLGTVFTCWPVETYWLAITGFQGKCMSKGGVTYSNAAINIATDIILIVVPAPLLWGLQIPKRQRIILMALFGVGTFATVISIVRLHALYVIDTSPPSEQSTQGVAIAIWSGIEINTGIICASIPAMRPLVVKLFPRLLLSSLYARATGKSHVYYNDTNDPGSSSQSQSQSQSRTHRGKHGASVSVTASANNRSDGERPKPALVGHRGKMSESGGGIKVHQSFELRSVPIQESRREIPDGEKSRDGSENNLVVSSWQDDSRFTFFKDGSEKERKKVNITKYPHEMV
ncbi:hypothetical protein QBC34DRAFT_387016 [Podospora aff. communis PSN243]|uniref:Rhodopsin domain-containing protein n=1 Tax=Podospora aff. communis PSN243 TaxID=3040156 RepID=A0AAV9G3C1_9PEZI|nr:hypothetical protein QBC34DRAFT_387016 [Podospora aff. communis PSN243]